MAKRKSKRLPKPGDTIGAFLCLTCPLGKDSGLDPIVAVRVSNVLSIKSISYGGEAVTEITLGRNSDLFNGGIVVERVKESPAKVLAMIRDYWDSFESKVGRG